MSVLEKRIDGFGAQFDKIENLIEDLAISVKEGFDRMVTKDEFNEKMAEIDNRFDGIENISIGGHERRIENLEDDVRIIKTKTEIKKK